uniref:tRNA (guanine-N(7)-)-methyltransferase non-catalytic subunit n=1 Tax=Pseudo-nitzschia australis TaxID=44445 RepID=A0A6V0BPJ5_9STRA|mmetsp:Transcript_17390/g.38088  ORF Transcript_17390/g.38088 Transcript_17390/m.38088 type:complete len:548 (-) Transcript_17390:19-1662(-)
MRHLIDRYEEYFLVGLKDRAYLVFDTPGNSDDADGGTTTIVELLPSSQDDGSKAAEQAQAQPESVTATANSVSTDDKDDGASNDNNDSTTKDNEKNNGKDSNDNEKNNNKDDKVKGGDQQQPPPRKRPSKSKIEEEQQLKEICAVAITGEKNNKVLRCAVARGNKSMNIYAVNLNKLVLESNSKSTQSSFLHYRTPKRVSCFTFAKLPNDNENGDGTNTMIPLLIAGDVAGDSYAYNIVSEIKEQQGQKLLLGHTASMITDIAILGNNNDDSNNKSLLVTSDRDEKIRISRFPDSYVLEGFLLGHTAYVTGLTVVVPSSSSQSSSPLVVSCAGDRTLRLWNLTTQSEICRLSTVSAEIPTAIAASYCSTSTSTTVAVIFDDSKRLSLYKITTAANADNPSLELLGSVDCPSQPLAIDFSECTDANDNAAASVLAVVMKDPDYIALYDIPNNQNQQDGNKPIAVPRGESSHLAKTLKELASEEKIAMPDTILEKDDYGNPVLQKENETRGPAALDQPWNRVERVGIAKEREKRRKTKKAKVAAAADNK